jgi:hypothetical protein
MPLLREVATIIRTQRPVDDQGDFADNQSPVIPCSICGTRLAYARSVRRRQSGLMGFGHPPGTCDPSAVAEHAAILANSVTRARAEDRNLRLG